MNKKAPHNKLQNSQDATNKNDGNPTAISAFNILESISEAFFSVNNNMEVTYFNTPAELFLNKKRGDVLGKNLFECFPEAKGSVFEKKYRQALSEKTTQVFETYFPPHKKWFSVRAYPFAGGLSVFFQVINKQKEIEHQLKEQNEEYLSLNEELKEINSEYASLNEEYLTANDELNELNNKLKLSEEKYKKAFKTSPDAININQMDGRYVDINNGFTKLTGYTKEDVIGKLSSEINIWAIPQDREKLIQGLRENGQYENLESKFRCKDGSIKTALMSASIIEINQAPHILSITRDITKQKEISKKLNFQAKLIKNVNDLVVATDLKGFITYVNDAQCKIFGLPADKIIGHHVSFFGEDKEYGATQKEILEKTLKNGKWRGEVVNFDKNENRIILDCRTTLLKDEKDQPIGMMGISSDITGHIIKEQQLKHLNEELAAQNEEYLSLNEELEENMETIQYLNIDLEQANQLEVLHRKISNSFALDKSDAFYASVLNIVLEVFNCDFGFFGYINEKGDFVSESMTHDIWDKCKIPDKSIVFPKHSWSGVWGESLKTKKTLIKNDHLNVPNGHVPLNNAIAGAINYKGKLIGQISLANKPQEWTQQNKTKLEDICQFIAPLLNARLSEKRYINELKKRNRAIEQTPACIIITNDKGNIEYANPQFYKTTGFTPDEVIGNDMSIIKSGHHNKAFYQELWKTIKAGNTWMGEFNNRTKNGTLFWENAIISPIKDDNNNITHFIAVKEDITQKKKLWDELLEAKEKAEESDRLKTAFLANMSHEIRTPLNGILGFSDLLINRKKISETQQNAFGAIVKKSADQLLQVIGDIVDISRIDSGDVKLVETNIDINKFLLQLNIMYQKKLKEAHKKIELRVKTLPENANLLADQNRLQQIFIKLLDNAFKFTTEGTIEFGIEEIRNKKVVFFVRDSGIGIPADKQQIIFNRFRQNQSGTNRVYGGNGLGLSIVKNLIELMDGHIYVESEIGHGTTFWFELPIQSTKKEIKKPAMPNKTKQHKILLVEDDESNCILLEELFADTSYSLSIANTGIDGIKKFNELNFDVVLLDLQLPDISGFEVAQQIREKNKSIKIIAQTAYSMPTDKEKALEAGCNLYITKPFDSDYLIKTIEDK